VKLPKVSMPPRVALIDAGVPRVRKALAR